MDRGLARSGGAGPAWLLALGLAACPSPPDDDTAPIPGDTWEEGDADADADTDTDTDADADADTDADADADADTPLSGEVTYRTTVDGKPECDAVVALQGTPFTGDCEGCDFAFRIEATLASDAGTARCVLDPILTYLDRDAAWFADPLLAFWTSVGDGDWTDVLATGYARDDTAYGGGFHPGPYWVLVAYDGGAYGEAGFDSSWLSWTFDQEYAYYDASTLYYHDCGDVLASRTTTGFGGAWSGTGAVPTDAPRLDVWSFDVDATSSETVRVTVDTTDPATASDLAAFVNDPSGCTALTADDSFGCTYPPPEYGCPSFELRRPEGGTWLVAVVATGAGAGAGVVDYAVTVDASTDPLLALVADDVSDHPVLWTATVEVDGLARVRP